MVTATIRKEKHKYAKKRLYDAVSYIKFNQKKHEGWLYHSGLAYIGKILSRYYQDTNNEKDEEEWKDFIYDSQKDLTNLKVSKLQIEDEDDGGMGYGSGEDEGGSGGGMRSDGVWNKNIDRLESEQNMADAEIVVPSMTKEDSPSSGNLKSSYVPPHLRNMAASPLPKAGNRKPKTAPDITSSMAFPSLSDSQTATPAGAWGKKKVGDDRGFESVKHGSTKNYSEDYAPPKLSTANRFDALSDSS